LWDSSIWIIYNLGHAGGYSLEKMKQLGRKIYVCCEKEINSPEED
jgi:hypothetical protein